MSFNGTSVGLDVHALSVVAHAVDEETGRVERARLCPGSRRDPRIGCTGCVARCGWPMRLGRRGSGWPGR